METIGYYLEIQGWMGLHFTRIKVIGETPKFYQIRAIALMRLRSHRTLKPGDTASVSRDKVVFKIGRLSIHG